MSLKTFLDNKDVRARFSDEFYKPRFSIKREILAQPITKHYSLVGTAFDYLLRFYVKLINPEAITKEWVAKLSVDRMRQLRVALNPQKGLISIDENLLKRADDMLSKSSKAYSDYIKTGKITNDLVKCTIFLAQLDTYFRAGIIDDNFGITDDGDIVDLSKLISLVSLDTFKAKDLCLLNPTFGEASELIGGADADLIIDDTLIDIKTTSKLEFKVEHFNEVIGYYTLLKIGGIPNAPFEPKIENLGFYYSRYAELYKFPVTEAISLHKYPSFMEWFRERAAQETRK